MAPVAVAAAVDPVEEILARRLEAVGIDGRWASTWAERCARRFVTEARKRGFDDPWNHDHLSDQQLDELVDLEDAILSEAAARRVEAEGDDKIRRVVAGIAGRVPALERALELRWRWRQALTESDLSPTARHVGHVLSLHMNRAGGSCFPGLKRLERETGYARSTICAALDDLEAAGFLIRHRAGGRRSSEYEATLVNCSTVEQLHETPRRNCSPIEQQQFESRTAPVRRSNTRKS